MRTSPVLTTSLTCAILNWNTGVLGLSEDRIEEIVVKSNDPKCDDCYYARDSDQSSDGRMFCRKPHPEMPSIPITKSLIAMSVLRDEVSHMVLVLRFRFVQPMFFPYGRYDGQERDDMFQERDDMSQKSDDFLYVGSLLQCFAERFVHALLFLSAMSAMAASQHSCNLTY